MPNRDELERASYFFANMTDHDLEMRGFSRDRKHCKIALELIRAELSRQENAPLTCDGCEREFNMCEIAICEKCIRLQNRDDRYEPKGEKE